MRDQIPALVNGLLHTKIKIVWGYRGSRKMLLAMEQGEVSSINLSWLAFKTNRKAWFDSGYAVPVIPMGPARERDLQNVPRLSELVDKKDLPTVGFMSPWSRSGAALLFRPASRRTVSHSCARLSTE
jgi:hypothetical protein